MSARAPIAGGVASIVLCAAVALPALATGISPALRVRVAEALAAFDRGEVAQAEGALDRLAREAPRSALVAREHAIVLLASGRAEDALTEIERAIALGDGEPEAAELRAVVLARLDRTLDAREAAAQAGTWEADLLGASLGDTAAAARASPWVDEASPRGAIAALTLAAHAGTTGARTTARSLAALAQDLARASDSGQVLAAARELGDRLDSGGDRLRASGRVRASIDYATNPLFAIDGGARKPQGLRSSFTAEAAFQAPISTARFDGAVRVDQRLQLVDRAALDGLDLTNLSLAASVEVPISSRPSAALIGLAIRFHDLWGDAFGTHWATTFEGGPTLTLPVDAATRIVLGVYGVGVDFIDRSPPDAQVSSQNRDRLGQRAVGSLVHDGGWLSLRADAAFVRDDAYGEAFDVRGGLVAGHLVARVTDEIAFSTGLSVLIRSFGPVGDAQVLGSAATRFETRVMAELGASVRLADGYYLLVDNVWIRSSGREEHDYTHNALSLGLEARW